MRYIVLGAGKQGTAIIHDLVHADGENSITIADRDRRALEVLAARFGDFRVEVQQVDLSDTARLYRLMESADVVISAVPYFFNLELARASVDAGTHFCDLGGNTEIVYRELELDGRARAKAVHVIPDCGLSPGMTNILAAHVLDLLPRVDRLEIRVGGLPKHPVPPLNYQLSFSVHGLLNEYIEPATIVRVLNSPGCSNLCISIFPITLFPLFYNFLLFFFKSFICCFWIFKVLYYLSFKTFFRC